ncbi:MAG: hypothetical protein PVG27_06475 [Chloroflexota bacterium]
MDEIGTTYLSTSKSMGFEMKSRTDVVEVEPRGLIHDRHETGPMKMYLRFEPDGDATNRVVEAAELLPTKGGRAWRPRTGI